MNKNKQAKELCDLAAELIAAALAKCEKLGVTVCTSAQSHKGGSAQVITFTGLTFRHPDLN